MMMMMMMMLLPNRLIAFTVYDDCVKCYCSIYYDLYIRVVIGLLAGHRVSDFGSGRVKGQSIWV